MTTTASHVSPAEAAGPDRALLATLQSASARTAVATAEMIGALADVDTHDAWADTAYPSLFEYCRGELNWSEAVIKKRITVARAVRRFPELLDELKSGALHVSAVQLLQRVLTVDNVSELIRRARGASKRAVEQLVATVAPKPAVPTSIRRLPLSTRVHVPASLPLTAFDEVSVQADSEPTARRETRRTAQRGTTQPLSATLHKLTVTVDDATRGLLEEVRALVSHRPAGKREVGVLLREALELLRADLRRTRRADVKRPRRRKAVVSEPSENAAESRSPGRVSAPIQASESRSPGRVSAPRQASESRSPGRVSAPCDRGSRRSRHIPAAVKRAVWERDGERCSYRDSVTGGRCVATHFLQIDHVQPFALGGEHVVGNCRVLCQHHNNRRVPSGLRVTGRSTA